MLSDFADLDKFFSKGKLPKNLDGFYRGKLVKMFPENAMESIANTIAKFWLPWYGKVFDNQNKSGFNVMPAYLEGLVKSRYGNKVILGKSALGLHVFPFRTIIAVGINSKVRILQLDYNQPENPAKVRSVVDELVDTGEKKYLGKAYIKNKIDYRLIAYFNLEK